MLNWIVVLVGHEPAAGTIPSAIPNRVSSRCQRWASGLLISYPMQRRWLPSTPATAAIPKKGLLRPGPLATATEPPSRDCDSGVALPWDCGIGLSLGSTTDDQPPSSHRHRTCCCCSISRTAALRCSARLSRRSSLSHRARRLACSYDSRASRAVRASAASPGLLVVSDDDDAVVTASSELPLLGGVITSISPVYGFTPVTPRKSPLALRLRRCRRSSRLARKSSRLRADASSPASSSVCRGGGVCV